MTFKIWNPNSAILNLNSKIKIPNFVFQFLTGMKDLTGTGVALVTPFNEDGSIDFPGLERLVNHVIDGGIDYLVCLGTTGEAVTLSEREKTDVVEAIRATNAGRLPMVLGIGGSNTREVLTDYETWDLSEFTAVLTASPAYNKPNQKGIYQHYKAIAQNTEADVILYNVPSRTGSNIEPATTLRLAEEFDNIIAVKEASPNFLQSTEILKDKPHGFMVISGDDEFGCPMTLAGGSGTISVIGQAYPELYSPMIGYALDGNPEEAYKLHYRLMDITRSIYREGNPTGIKSLLSHLGICKPFTRLPLVPASEELSRYIKELAEKI